MDAERWDKRYASAERVFSEQPTPFLVELAGDLTPARALDLGAGEGRHAVWLATRGWRVTAVDFSRVGLRKARERAAAEGVELDCVRADLLEYRPPPRSFELVLLAYIHFAAAERDVVFPSAAEAVAPGGHLLAVGRHLDDLGRDHGRGPPDPDRRLTPERLTGAFPGLDPLRCESAWRRVDDDLGPERVLDALLWARRSG